MQKSIFAAFLPIAIVVFGFNSSAFAGQQITTRTGPNGRQQVTSRTVGNGQQTTTRTGPSGRQQVTSRTVGNGQQTTIRTGPNGRQQTTTRTVTH
jgi:hypothetical protein